MSATLDQYVDDCEVYAHWSKRLIYTPGVAGLAEEHGAYWLIDAVASYQGPKLARKDPRLADFQIWYLKLRPQPGMEHAAVLECWADSGADERPLVSQKIEYTDFPRDIKLYCERGQMMTLMLPEER